MTPHLELNKALKDNVSYYRLDMLHNDYFDDPLIDVTTLPSQCKLIDIGGIKGISVINRNKGVEIYSPSSPNHRMSVTPSGHVIIRQHRLYHTTKCCLFFSFLDYLVYQTYVVKSDRTFQFPQFNDCIIICSPQYFLDAMLDQERYITTYCFLPNDIVGKVMLSTLKQRYSSKIADISEKYYFASDFYDYLNLKYCLKQKDKH